VKSHDSGTKYDIGRPAVSPTLVRKKTLADEIDGLDVMWFHTILLPLGGNVRPITHHGRASLGI